LKPKKLDVDVLLYYPLSEPISDVPKEINKVISIQIQYLVELALKFPQYPQVGYFHFTIPGIDRALSLAYPVDPLANDESQLVKLRQEYHEIYRLPMDRPLVRMVNAIVFSGNKQGQRLFNVHETLHLPQSTRIAQVRGQYEYYHYMQDQFDDSGWGCAYLSLQTIESWFIHQNYTNKPVQSHLEIQKMLFALGQKGKNIIGSREWIGSLEVAAVLEKYMGIKYKIIHLMKGSDVAQQYRQLLDHFEINGTPIMIGGGQLAYTLLGVSYNESLDKLMFLILDPHYTGKDELQSIQKKGWCAWKDISLFKDSYFYNLCLPQVPGAIGKGQGRTNPLELI
jgi:hypothetical protein